MEQIYEKIKFMSYTYPCEVIVCIWCIFLLFSMLVAKKKSLFDDRPMEIQELTYIIKQDITGLNQQIAQLQEVISHYIN